MTDFHLTQPASPAWSTGRVRGNTGSSRLQTWATA